MRRLMAVTALFACSVWAFTATITDPVGDKGTGDSLSATEFNNLKNAFLNEINGNLDEANIENGTVGTDELAADAVTPAKVDEDNTTAFQMLGISVTSGTVTTINCTTATITTISNSPTFTYGLSAATATITTLSGTTVNVTTVTTTAGIAIAATKRLYLDGGGDTYISEGGANDIYINAGGVNIARAIYVAGGNSQLYVPVQLALASGSTFYFDGGSDTYFREGSANVISAYAGGTLMQQWASTYILLYGSILSGIAGSGIGDIGSATNYFNEINYKTLTDRGCLGWFDEGVELRDGTKVSDTDALLAIQRHPTDKTIYGADKLDYRTFPKVAYLPAKDENGNLYPRDPVTDKPLPVTQKNKDGKEELVYPQDGIEMTSMFSIMIGATKELTLRVKVLEEDNLALKEQIAAMDARLKALEEAGAVLK